MQTVGKEVFALLAKAVESGDRVGSQRKKWEVRKLRSHGICVVVPRPKVS
jgi:hypothetical protein